MSEITSAGNVYVGNNSYQFMMMVNSFLVMIPISFNFKKSLVIFNNDKNNTYDIEEIKEFKSLILTSNINFTEELDNRRCNNDKALREFKFIKTTDYIKITENLIEYISENSNGDTILKKLDYENILYHTIYFTLNLYAQLKCNNKKWKLW